MPNMDWTPHEERRLAVEAGVDPRTAHRWLKGLAVTSTCAARLERALKALGQEKPCPEPNP